MAVGVTVAVAVGVGVGLSPSVTVRVTGTATKGCTGSLLPTQTFAWCVPTVSALAFMCTVISSLSLGGILPKQGSARSRGPRLAGRKALRKQSPELHAGFHGSGGPRYSPHRSWYYNSDLEIELANGPTLWIEDLKVVCRFRMEHTRRNETLCGNISQGKAGELVKENGPEPAGVAPVLATNRWLGTDGVATPTNARNTPNRKILNPTTMRRLTNAD